MLCANYLLLCDAILEQQVLCVYEGRYRCAYITGTRKRGAEAVLAWQFGESSSPLPQWRCLKLANVSDAHARNGRR
ncbi:MULTISPECIES: hypothetical protein [unclassified Bradyrhizobium]|uniref:hypothetical protein n=1 Tax=unclassified Bradyrhizobium TaxID=2631580 RepID=UPI0024794C0A|nr:MULTISPECIES: hypothetical protein [unclassified Bradyrhizobium]WGR67779.1 hypothetical protein MTX24_20120 [Bradyrhizobium sp. ISRA426]WGR79831.1 hypothetical protein MTX21_05235 [Bradyrhizobium sp. ISRA430]WGR83018.1 hypothetical protein MTX25_19800 [Bradyrhizobium sp. ISRA432]